ncbi:flagellar biosynthesis protein FlhB [bacterium DOLZORAL124_64_63]|nr:MAG: flagellar biosynthesis protein FlhB [bacterium DOLZORAL124_64_63]
MPDQEKTEQPTPKRRSEAREKGNVPKSQEVASAFVMLAALGSLWLSGSWMFREMTDLGREIFQGLHGAAVAPLWTHRLFLTVFQQVMILLSPVFIAVFLAGVAANIAQFGFLLSAKSLTPNFGKLNPLSGLKRLFSLRSLVELLKSLVKMSLIGGIAIALLYQEADQMPGLIQSSVGPILEYIGREALRIAFYACMGMIFIAALDLFYQRWQYEEDLKMSRQEVRDEHKQQEGDPQIKARVRAMQMEMARRRMMTSVPEADVIITNPTEIAVALKYEAGKSAAPKVTAKGRGHVAARIREIAKDAGVPLVEDKPLARTLFRNVEIGDIIPPDLYRAVAEVLAYVYRLRHRTDGIRPGNRMF